MSFQQNKSLFEGYDYFFCCLGTLTKVGEELFRKVDHDYPIEFAKIAKAHEAKRFVLVSSLGASPTSWFLYAKTKGETERDIKELELEKFTIVRPGMLQERGGDFRFKEMIGGIIPFLGKIKCMDVAKAMIEIC